MQAYNIECKPTGGTHCVLFVFISQYLAVQSRDFKINIRWMNEWMKIANTDTQYEPGNIFSSLYVLKRNNRSKMESLVVSSTKT